MNHCLQIECVIPDL